MRATTAVVIVNLLLAIIGAGGFTAWRRAQAESAAAAKTVTWGGPEREWRDVHGVVRALVPDLGIIVLTHEDIPGFMPGMTMGFRLAAPQIPESLSVGDAVRFTVRGSPPLVVLTAIEKAP
jgi:Cu/Ag efflux protein CusF